ncbi:MAG: hypothetical protein NT001_05290 [Candidatus Woesearchaeota archaeon]|nr:hypothetical protein [Candidatus Woesearchaeota archaeon]
MYTIDIHHKRKREDHSDELRDLAKGYNPLKVVTHKKPDKGNVSLSFRTIEDAIGVMDELRKVDYISRSDLNDTRKTSAKTFNQH